VIFTSTELEEMTRVCDRVLVFHEGTISGELVGDQIAEANIMRLSFGQQSEQPRKESEE
jgi:ABC-type sugar transport system ATPase subunit